MKHFQRGHDNLTCFHVQAFLELLDQCKCNFFKAQGLNLYKQKIEEVVSSWKALQSIGCSLACGANRSAVLEASPLEACGRIAVDTMHNLIRPQRPAVQDGSNDVDHFHAMQLNAEKLPLPDPAFDSNSSHADSVIPEDWIIDLKRAVQGHVDTCHEDTQDATVFSVYTWLLDHQSQRLCRGSKLVFLGDSPVDWTEDVIRPWRHLIRPEEPVFIDIVLPTPLTSDLEDHLAHLILTQRPSQESSVLISMNFKGDNPPEVLIRVATVLPKKCTANDVIQATPLLALYSKNRFNWEHPELHSDDQEFRTRHGQCIQGTIQPETDFRSEVLESEDDHNNLLQYKSKVSEFCLEPRFPTIVQPDTCKGTDLQEDIDVPMMSSHPTTRLSRRPRPLHDGTEQWFWDLGQIFLLRLFKKLSMVTRIFICRLGMLIIDITYIADSQDLSDWISVQLRGLKNSDICGVTCLIPLLLFQSLSLVQDRYRVAIRTTIVMSSLNRIDHRANLRAS
jgi:hypothetical protein